MNLSVRNHAARTRALWIQHKCKGIHLKSLLSDFILDSEEKNESNSQTNGKGLNKIKF